MKAKTLFKANFHQILLVIFAFAVMVMVSYFYVSSIVQQQMQSNGDVSLDLTQTTVAASLSEAEMIFSSVIRSVDSMIANDQANK